METFPAAALPACLVHIVDSGGRWELVETLFVSLVASWPVQSRILAVSVISDN
jgi:hypothetical protein